MENLLEVRNLSKVYKKQNSSFQAIKDISFSVKKGECLGIVGESGSGKTTIARILSNLVKQDMGEVYFKGKLRENEFLKDIQMVFQQSDKSFNPKIKILNSIIEPMQNYGVDKNEATKIALDTLKLCGLKADMFEKYPYQLSGGQAQRCAIARAISLNPALLICDEATSALDEDIENQVIKLLMDIKEKHDMTYIFVSHNIELVRQICTRIIVVQNGEIVEVGKCKEIFSNPSHPYTKLLLNATI